MSTPAFHCTSSNAVFFGQSNLLVIDGDLNRIGIGTNAPAYPLTVISSSTEPNIYTNGDIVSFSDARFKLDVQRISTPLERISQMSGYTYIRLDAKSTQSDPNVDDILPQKRFTGVIAQELQKVLPEAVYSDPVDGTLCVAYGNLAGLFVECINALRTRIEVLENK